MLRRLPIVLGCPTKRILLQRTDHLAEGFELKLLERSNLHGFYSACESWVCVGFRVQGSGFRV